MATISDPNGGRDVKEWQGKTPNSVPPPTVKARVFLRAGGRCHITGLKIAGKPWQVEHIKPLWAGGENREKNMAPALVDPHKEKTAEEGDIREKADRVRIKHLGLKPKPIGNSKIQSRGFGKRLWQPGESTGD